VSAGAEPPKGHRPVVVPDLIGQNPRFRAIVDGERTFVPSYVTAAGATVVCGGIHSGAGGGCAVPGPTTVHTAQPSETRPATPASTLAIAALRARDLAQLDLKPTNVVLRDGPRVVIDLGYARRIGSLQPAGRPVGMQGTRAGAVNVPTGPVHHGLLRRGCDPVRGAHPAAPPSTVRGRYHRSWRRSSPGSCNAVRNG
jgi:hypothetical protein